MTPQETASDTAKSQMQMYLDVYKHHFDLFVKAVFLYFATIGATAGYVFASSTTRGAKISVLLVGAALSVVAECACVVSRRWVMAVDQRVAKFAEELGVESFPFSGARNTTIVVQAVTSVFVVAALTSAGVFIWAQP